MSIVIKYARDVQKEYANSHTIKFDTLRGRGMSGKICCAVKTLSQRVMPRVGFSPPLSAVPHYCPSRTLSLSIPFLVVCFVGLGGDFFFLISCCFLWFLCIYFLSLLCYDSLIASDCLCARSSLIRTVPYVLYNIRSPPSQEGPLRESHQSLRVLNCWP